MGRITKRILDLSIASIILLMTLPILIIVATIIWLESRGPVFYRAERVGYKNSRLQMLKFRKMHHDAHDRPLTLNDDERFTRIGGFLSRAKLDELPQLWHVLTGEMSLIGPRPEDPKFVADRDEYDQILSVRPGITGLSQIAFANESEILCEENPIDHYRQEIFPQKIDLDLLYTEQPSLWMDLKILFWTAAAVVLRRPIAVHRNTGKMSLRLRPETC